MQTALTNEQLTAQLQALQAGMVTVEQTLNDLIPKMETTIQDSKAFIIDINDKLIEKINPIVEADPVDMMLKVDTRLQEIVKSMEDRGMQAGEYYAKVRDMETALTALKTVSDQSIGELRTFTSRLDGMHAQVITVTNDLAGEKNQANARYVSTQSQILTATAGQASSSGTGGGRTKDPLVTHKLLLNKVALTGEEDYDAFDEWYSDMMDDFEILIPDSKRIMMEAEQDKSAITMTRLMSHSNPQLATHVSRELYSVLKKKTTGQARSQLKSIGENEGLEAWRLIRANLCRKDGQRLQGEFDTLTSLQPIKIGHFKEFPTLHKRWESELTKFASIDPEYRLGKFQKRNIIYRALPQEIRDDIDREQAHNPELSVYDDLINFIINISRSNKYQKTTLPKPLSANLVGESPSAAAPAQTEPEEANVKYTIDEWIMYMYQDEGQAYIAAGNPLPEEGILALNSVVKGKGKGKGTPQWQKGTGKGKGAAKGYQSWTPKGKGKGNKGEDNKGKGKGKGKDHIQCHGCLEYGHYVRDCPQRSVQMVEDTNWGSDWPSQSGWTGQSSNRVALIVTDQPFTGYRQETVGKKPAHTSNSNITATANWNFDGNNLGDEHNFHDVETGAHVNEKYVTKIGQKLLKMILFCNK